MPEPTVDLLLEDSLTPVAWILRASACYLLRHGLYLDPSVTTDDPYRFDWDLWDPNDHYQWSSHPLTPAASPQGAIAMVVYGHPVPDPADDGSVEYALFADALSEYWISFAPDDRDYGSHTTAQHAAQDLLLAAKERDRTAGYTFGDKWSELDRIALSTFGVNPRTPNGSPMEMEVVVNDHTCEGAWPRLGLHRGHLGGAGVDRRERGALVHPPTRCRGGLEAGGRCRCRRGRLAGVPVRRVGDLRPVPVAARHRLAAAALGRSAPRCGTGRVWSPTGTCPGCSPTTARNPSSTIAGPLAVDGLMVMATGALVAAGRYRNTTAPAPPVPLSVPATPAPSAAPSGPVAPIPTLPPTVPAAKPETPPSAGAGCTHPGCPGDASHPNPPDRRPGRVGARVPTRSPDHNPYPSQQDDPTSREAGTVRPDISCRPGRPCQPKPPLEPALLARVRHVATEYRTEHGTPITPGQLAVRLKVTSEQANQALAVLDLDPDSPTSGESRPSTARPVKATR